jgi:hypothetical protein
VCSRLSSDESGITCVFILFVSSFPNMIIPPQALEAPREPFLKFRLCNPSSRLMPI